MKNALAMRQERFFSVIWGRARFSRRLTLGVPVNVAGFR